MRIKINHFNLGLFNETCFVCGQALEGYFLKVAETLRNEYSVKATVYVYDRDEMTDKVKRSLKYCYSVLFMLTPGVTEAAAKDENNLFRKVFAFTNKKNPYAVSLVAVNGCMVDYGVEYPDDMKSFRWLHRKTFNIYQSTPSAIADEFYKEFRLHYNRRERKKLELLSNKGVSTQTEMYEKLSGILKLAVTVILLSSLADLINIFYGLGFVKSILNVVASVVTPVSLAVLPIVWFNLRDRSLDVSTVFSDFKHRTRTRLSILLGFGSISLSAVVYAGFLSEIKEQYEAFSTLVTSGIYFIILGGMLAYNLVMKHVCNTSFDYLELAARRMKTRLIALPIAAAIFGAIYVYMKIFTIL